MGFLEVLVYLAISYVVARLLAPKIENEQGPVEFRPPEPRPGEPVPVVFGTVKLSPAVTWFGDVHADELTKSEGGIFGFFEQEIPLGYEYSAGMQLTICHGPIDSIENIWIGEQEVIRKAKYVGSVGGGIPSSGWPNPRDPDLPLVYQADPLLVNFNMPDFFGGIEEGGGITGQMDFHFGSNTQWPNDYLARFWGADITPNYRGICYAVLRRMNLGKSPTPQGWWFVVKRIPDVLGQTAYHAIGDDANAAEIIWDILTNTVWGVGLPSSDLDIATFQACGQTLHGEGLGYSGVLTSKSPAWSAIRTVLSHVDGILYQDPLTGLIGMKLVRNDYTVGTLPELNEQNASIVEFVRGSWRETTNEHHVRFTDRARRFARDTRQAQNLANIQALGGQINSATVDLPGLTNGTVAQEAAERINRAGSQPLARGRFRADRTAYTFHQGTVFKASFAEDNIDELVMRVVRVNYGSLLEGTIEIEAVQDVWDISGVAYGQPTDIESDVPCGPLALLLTGYDPSGDPAAEYGEGEAVVFEAPYWFAGANRRAYATVSRQKNSDLHWVPWRAEQGLEPVEVPVVEGFHPVGYLEADLAQTTAATGVTLDVRTAGELEDLTSTDGAGLTAGNRLALIGTEIFAWQTVTDQGGGVYRISGVMRGQLDTVPDYHPAGTEVYFISSVGGADGRIDVSSRNYSANTRVDVWPRRVDGEGTFYDIERIESVGVLLKDRALAPYPPGNVQLNSNGYAAWPSSVVGDATLSWTHRSRTAQTTMVAQDDATSYTLEGTLTIEVLLDGTKVREWLGQTGTSVVYDIADRITDDGDMTKQVQFRITPVGASSEIGIVRVTPPFTMSET